MSKNKDVAEKANTEVGLPQNWQEELAQRANDAAASVRPSSSVISLRSGIVSYQDIAAPDNKLDLVIIGFAQEHTFYREKWDPDNTTSPECYALAPGDMDMADITPAADVPAPISERCGNCEYMEWGSSLQGGRGKACQQRYRLIAIPAASLGSSDEILTAEAATIKLPVTSGKIWAQYLQTVAALYKRPEWGVITTLSAKPDAKTQFKATFETNGLVDFEGKPELYSAITQKIGLVQGALMRGYDIGEEKEQAQPDAKSKAAS